MGYTGQSTLNIKHLKLIESIQHKKGDLIS
jgi:hypothetical protein